MGTATPGSAFPVGSTTVTYTATDNAGNTASCSFTVTIVVRTIRVTGLVVDAETTAAMAGVNVSLGSFVPRTFATTPRITTTARTTRRKTKKAARRDVDEELEAVEEDEVLSRHARSAAAPVIVSNAWILSDATGRFVMDVSADPRDLSFSVNIGGRVSQFDLNIHAAMGPAISIVIGVTTLTQRDEWRVVTAWVGDGLAAHNNFDARMATPFGCVVGPAVPGCVDTDGTRLAELNANFFANSSVHRGTGPESIDISGNQDGVYRHFVYVPQVEGSFVDSQLQACVHSSSGQRSCLHVTLDGAVAAAGSSAGLWRFWHTFSLDLSAQTVRPVNTISCDPAISTGSTALLPAELPRRC